eukprot:TRINITY_DN35611_c0_g1_i1.p1 TRINITY_DN35611_c0_g1~~TRINITY_DN35611_c0_g1_i1.p1  ORF type:complete len:226 (+),score=28.37 TRINITY_DN35611_c0_g1_i1:101-778(+)
MSDLSSRRQLGQINILLRSLFVFVLGFCCSDSVTAFRFTIDRKECFTQYVDSESQVVHGSFVVVKSENPWASRFEGSGLDLTVEAPAGYHAYSAHQKTEDKFSFVAVRRGDYRFCFVNHSPIHESVAFEIHVGHHSPSVDEIAKQEHFDPLLEQVMLLEDSVTNIFYECRWLFHHAQRQAELSKITAWRLTVKTIVQAAALVGTSVLQVYLLRRLFERKMKQSRV